MDLGSDGGTGGGVEVAGGALPPAPLALPPVSTKAPPGTIEVDVVIGFFLERRWKSTVINNIIPTPYSAARLQGGRYTYAAYFSMPIVDSIIHTHKQRKRRERELVRERVRGRMSESEIDGERER